MSIERGFFGHFFQYWVIKFKYGPQFKKEEQESLSVIKAEEDEIQVGQKLKNFFQFGNPFSSRQGTFSL